MSDPFLCLFVLSRPSVIPALFFCPSAPALSIARERAILELISEGWRIAFNSHGLEEESPNT